MLKKDPVFLHRFVLSEEGVSEGREMINSAKMSFDLPGTLVDDQISKYIYTENQIRKLYGLKDHGKQIRIMPNLTMPYFQQLKPTVVPLFSSKAVLCDFVSNLEKFLDIPDFKIASYRFNNRRKDEIRNGACVIDPQPEIALCSLTWLKFVRDPKTDVITNIDFVSVL